MPTEQGKRNMRAIGEGRLAPAPVTLTQTQLAAPAGGTGATAGAYDSAANRDLMIASVNAARTDIAAIVAALKAHGIAI